jgi:hypothetical protein
MRQRFVSLKLSAKPYGASSLWPAVVHELSGRWSVRSVWTIAAAMRVALVAISA